MKKKIRNLIVRLLPNRYYSSIVYYKHFKKFPDFKSPKTFSEKMQWIKLYGNLSEYSKYVDKYEVRNYIKETIGDRYLINLLNIYESTDEINYEELPNRFVLKGTHGCGYNIIIKDKSLINKEEIKNKFAKWLKEDYSVLSKEIQYKSIKPRIVCEEYIEDKEGELIDYKIYCFSGKAEFIQVISNRKSNMCQDFYDLNWNKLDLRADETPSKVNIKKPEKLEEMIRISEKLSNEFPFVRVDLYYVDNKIYFGELTFTPKGGMVKFKSEEYDIKFGSLINI